MDEMRKVNKFHGHSLLSTCTKQIYNCSILFLYGQEKANFYGGKIRFSQKLSPALYALSHSAPKKVKDNVKVQDKWSQYNDRFPRGKCSKLQ